MMIGDSESMTYQAGKNLGIPTGCVGWSIKGEGENSRIRGGLYFRHMRDLLDIVGAKGNE